MVHLGVRKGFINIRGYDGLREIWKEGLILQMEEIWLVSGENILEIRKVLWTLRVVWRNLGRILRIWK